MLRVFGRFRPQPLFQPRSVAIIGAESVPGRRALANLAASGFPGAIHLPETADALPPGTDLVVVAGGALAPALASAAAAKAGVAIALVDGEPGRAAPPFLGPSSFGVIVPGARLDCSVGHLPAPAGSLAIVSPSTALCRTVLDWAEPNGVGFSHIVGVGLQRGLDAASVLDVIAREPGVAAILLDIRTVPDPRAFLSAGRAAARLRPVVALHAGSRQSDPSGRGAHVLEAALRRAGILHVSTMAELLAAAEILTHARPLRSERLVVVTNAVGPGQLAADQAVRLGVPLARLDPVARTLLDLHLPPQPAESGLIWTGDEQPTRPAEAASMLSAVKEIGGIVAVLAPTGTGDAAGVAALAAARPTIKQPLIACVLGETTAAPHRRTLTAAGLPVFASPEQAVRAFGQLVMQRRAREAARELPSSRVLRLAPDLERVRRVIEQVRRAGRLALFQDEALDILSAYGLGTVPYRPVAGAEEAGVAAGLLGFPVAVKQRRLDPDAAGVLLLDLPDQAAVCHAAARLDGGTGLLVQRQAGRAQRLRVGVADDELFGPAIGFGPGGRDRAGDVTYDLPPLNFALATALIERSAAAKLLASGQGHGAANVDAVADALVRVGQIVLNFPEIEAISIDPLFADEAGVSAAEAFMRLRPAGVFGQAAIAPYPAEWAERWTTRTGESLEIRPIRPEDAGAYGELVRRLTPEDIRYRFFMALRELSAEQIARMTQIDYDREMAVVAMRGEALLGVASLVQQPGEGGEFAVVVDPAMKGSGLGHHLMARMIDWGRSRGMATISGQVLSDNRRMLAFVRRLGFSVRRDPDDPDIVEARLTL